MNVYRLLAAPIALSLCVAVAHAQNFPNLAAGHYKWVAMTSNDPLPANMVGGGICRVAMHGGVHPGKILADKKSCNVAWGNFGNDYHQFEVFTGDVEGIWYPIRDGDRVFPQPSYHLVGGHLEDGTPIYVCKASDPGKGQIIGKLVAQNCNVEWGGKELILSSYRCLYNLNPASVIENP
jgi:hypothetical protein